MEVARRPGRVLQELPVIFAAALDGDELDVSLRWVPVEDALVLEERHLLLRC